MLTFKWIPFADLSLDQLYEVLHLRSAVFVVAQNCIFLDPDKRDQDAIHLLGYENNMLLAYLRLFPPMQHQKISFGRIVTADAARNKGYGKQLMNQMLAYCNQYFPNQAIECSAQLYLQAFYESFGFKCVGNPYDEDGILHVHMVR